MTEKDSIWVIIDDKIGNANQAIALANALGASYQIKKLKYNFLSHLPNWLKFNSLMGVDIKLSSSIDLPYPDLIISSSRKAAAVNNYIKKQNPKCFSVHLMHPDLPFEDFDMVCLPFHDMHSQYADVSNILYTIGAPSCLDPSKLKEAGEKLHLALAHLKGPFISLMLGGKTKQGDYTSEEWQWLMNKANSLANSVNGSLLITTSRRTAPNVAEQLTKSITAPYFLYDWHKMQALENPYLGFLAISDYFIVSGDSVSICSEALGTGRPVYVYRKDHLLSNKHRKFLDYLAKLSYTKLLEENSRLEQWEYLPLQEAQRVAQVIKEKLTNASIALSS